MVPDSEASSNRQAPSAPLTPDCERCCGLCCVAPSFSASADFAIDKGAGEPCPNLRPDFRCAIHEQLRLKGFSGCAVYDCHGAGQRVTQGTFGGRDWRTEPEIAERMFQAFMVMRRLHELLLYLNEALKLEPARPLYRKLADARDELDRLGELGVDDLLAVDVDLHQRGVSALLRRVSELMRAAGVARETRRKEDA